MPITTFHIPGDGPGLVAGHLIERIQIPVFAYKLVRQDPRLLCERFQDFLRFGEWYECDEWGR